MDNEYEYYYPGVYDEADTKVLEKFQAELDRINNKGEIDIPKLVSGQLAGQPGVMDWVTTVTADMMMTMADSYVRENPLFTDRDYAKKTKYGDLIAFPFPAAVPFMPAMPKAEGIGDYMVVSAHNDTANFYRPIYEGDTLYPVLTEQHFKDLTPAAGSHYRTFAMIGTGKVYNQKGELVAEGANILKESFRRHKDPAMRNKNKAHAWESPDWWHQRPAHSYTDEDWEYIISMWKKEKVRGAEILYWDDVNIGDEPTPTVAGPVVNDTDIDMMFTIPQWATETKKYVLNPETFARMVKNKHGIYILPENLEKKPAPKRPVDPDATPGISNSDGRAVIQNAVATQWAAGMLLNWMGDEGWLQRIGWDIMPNPPGYPESVIPHLTGRPALFDKFPYLDKVPYMKGKRADCHGMEGDVFINQAYVCDKYEKDGEFFVDLIWWCETIDKYLIEEGFATVKLPKKN